MSILKSAIIVGAFGDLALQFIVKNSGEINKYGLRTYFERHGSLESVFIASGMSATFASIYNCIDPKWSPILMVWFGTVLDVIFRIYRKKIFPSLDDYYESVPWYYTIVWAIIPMFMIKHLNNYIE